MRLCVRSALIIITAASLLGPLLGAGPASAARSGGTASGSSADCTLTSAPWQVETGAGSAASSVADVVIVECRAGLAGQQVLISSPQLSTLCRNTLSWYTDSTSSSGTYGRGESFDVYLDDDGNATAVLWGGPSCATGRALITAELVSASYTARASFTIRAPVSTSKGITAAPASEVEDATFSGAAVVFNIEFTAAAKGDTADISSPQLSSRCHGHLHWVGADEARLASGESATVALDGDGNAFVVALAGPSCASGQSLVTADLQDYPYTLVQTHVNILPPMPTH